MDQEKLNELRDYYDHADTADDMADAELDTTVVPSPMSGITIRLPAELLERVRQFAAAEHVKTTALIRQWVEEAVSSRSTHQGGGVGGALIGGPVSPLTAVLSSDLSIFTTSEDIDETWLLAMDFDRVAGL